MKKLLPSLHAGDLVDLSGLASGNSHVPLVLWLPALDPLQKINGGAAELRIWQL